MLGDDICHLLTYLIQIDYLPFFCSVHGVEQCLCDDGILDRKRTNVNKSKNKYNGRCANDNFKHDKSPCFTGINLFNSLIHLNSTYIKKNE